MTSKAEGCSFPISLKATGVINVQNPVEKAVQEGRFEELN